MGRRRQQKSEYTLGEAAKQLGIDVDTLIHDATQGVVALALPAGVGSWGGDPYATIYVSASDILDARNGSGKLSCGTHVFCRSAIVARASTSLFVSSIAPEPKDDELEGYQDFELRPIGSVQRDVSLSELVVTHDELTHFGREREKVNDGSPKDDPTYTPPNWASPPLKAYLTSIPKSRYQQSIRYAIIQVAQGWPLAKNGSPRSGTDVSRELESKLIFEGLTSPQSDAIWGWLTKADDAGVIAIPAELRKAGRRPESD